MRVKPGKQLNVYLPYGLNVYNIDSLLQVPVCPISLKQFPTDAAVCVLTSQW